MNNSRRIFLLTLFFASLMNERSYAQQQSATSANSETLKSTNLQNFRRTTIVKTQADTIKRVFKELIQELPADNNAMIKIVNTTCNIDIRTWSEAKVKLVTTIGIPEKQAEKISEQQMMDDAGIIFKSFGNRVDIQTRATFSATEQTTGKLFRSVGDNVKFQDQYIHVTQSASPRSPDQPLRWMTTGSTIRGFTLYIPENSRLDIDNKNTGIIISTDINDARFKLSRSSLDARNFRKLSITAEYYSINISDVQEADLQLENGNFTGGVIQSLDLDSKGSEVDYESGKLLYLRSQSDRISLDEIERVGGRKLYGDLRIGKLTSEIDLEGTNADIKIRNISATVEKVKINDRYANLRLPVKYVAGFELSFNGENSTVFAPFEKIVKQDTIIFSGPVSVRKKDIRLKPTDTKTVKEVIIEGVSSNGEKMIFTAVPTTGNKLSDGFPESRAPSRFTASGGNTTAKPTVFNITCNQCSVDFK